MEKDLKLKFQTLNFKIEFFLFFIFADLPESPNRLKLHIAYLVIYIYIHKCSQKEIREI